MTRAAAVLFSAALFAFACSGEGGDFFDASVSDGGDYMGSFWDCTCSGLAGHECIYNFCSDGEPVDRLEQSCNWTCECRCSPRDDSRPERSGPDTCILPGHPHVSPNAPSYGCGD